MMGVVVNGSVSISNRGFGPARPTCLARFRRPIRDDAAMLEDVKIQHLISKREQTARQS